MDMNIQTSYLNKVKVKLYNIDFCVQIGVGTVCVIQNTGGRKKVNRWHFMVEIEKEANVRLQCVVNTNCSGNFSVVLEIQMALCNLIKVKE